MPFVQTPKLKLHYQVTGDGEQNIILVHGNFASWRWWRPLMERLPEKFRVFAFDMRSCGESDRPQYGRTIQLLADDLRDFADALNVPSFHLVGHSLGGAAALQFALDHSARVESLTLISPAPAEGMPLATYAPSWTRVFGSGPSLMTMDVSYRFWQALGVNRPVLRRGLKKMTPTLNHNDVQFEELVRDAARMAPDAVVEHLRALDEWNVQDQISHLLTRVLIVWGRHDALVPLPPLQRTANALPNARLVIWDDVGHSPQIEQPDRFAHLLLDFIESKGMPPLAATPSFWRRLSDRARKIFDH